MFGGAALVMAWMFFAPQFKQSKVAVEVQGIRSYESKTVNANEIIESINA